MSPGLLDDEKEIGDVPEYPPPPLVVVRLNEDRANAAPLKGYSLMLCPFDDILSNRRLDME